MRKIFYRSLCLAMALAVATSSCVDSDNGSDTFLSSMGQCLTRGENISSHAYNFNKMSFMADYYNDNATADVTIIGMVVPDAGNSNGIVLPKMVLKGLKWAYNRQGWKVIEQTNVVPEVQGMSVVPTFDSVSFCVADVFDTSGNYKPGLQYEFEVNYNGQKYSLVGSCMTGTTTSTSPSGTDYVPESDTSVLQKPTYWLDFDFANSTADLYLYNAKFLDRMPSLNLLFPKIPYTISGTVVTLETAALTPMFGQTPFPTFPIANLKGTMDYLTSTLKLEFNCNYSGSDYKVKIDSKY